MLSVMFIEFRFMGQILVDDLLDFYKKVICMASLTGVAGTSTFNVNCRVFCIRTHPIPRQKSPCDKLRNSSCSIRGKPGNAFTHSLHTLRAELCRDMQTCARPVCSVAL